MALSRAKSVPPGIVDASKGSAPFVTRILVSSFHGGRFPCEFSRGDAPRSLASDILCQENTFIVLAWTVSDKVCRKKS
eukprot:m.279692 g.279692  ORF g.279692 m.279692 type:complete len:78 (+) comp19811_c0_seq2:501-734(+)